MVHYIPKAAVVAELERRKRKLLDHIICERDKEWVVRTVHQLNRIIMFIDTLEVTDVDAIRRNWYNQGYLKGRREANIPARELGLPSELNTLEVKEVNVNKEIEDFEEKIIKSSKAYRAYREECGIKDPILLDEVEEAYYAAYEQCYKDNVKSHRDYYQKLDCGKWQTKTK